MRNLFLIFSICLLASCSNDDEAIPNIENIYGSWEKAESISAEQFDLDSTYSYSAKQVLKLNRDNSFEWLIYVTNSESGEIIGYRQKETGTFSQNENVLSFNLDRFEPEQDATSSSYKLTALENLMLTDQNITMNYKFKLLTSIKTLFFDFPSCSSNNTCRADFELNKVD
ncbi:hypothetical protein BC962_1139 [Gillisia mitskevichiae]|uniref:Lipocalin-like protein n=1 Tax=Gillisia mitskevichiae TaxID=270921 RepID=A0A495Q033_9FLAO|nr:hypothetical protein [Gillisia mitskevichiae]RKS56160.1 hypothetical protein BC962_1139 [Gillisia mitskevichiae]